MVARIGRLPIQALFCGFKFVVILFLREIADWRTAEIFYKQEDLPNETSHDKLVLCFFLPGEL